MVTSGGFLSRTRSKLGPNRCYVDSILLKPIFPSIQDRWFRSCQQLTFTVHQEILFAPIEAKIQLFKSYCYPIYECAHWRQSFQNFIRKLTVSYSDTFKRLINVPRYTSSSMAFAMNATDYINVVFRKFANSLMSRVIAYCNSMSLPLSIAMHITSLH